MGVKNPLSYTQLRDQNIDILLKEALGLPIFDKKTITPQAGGTKPPGSDLATQTFEDREIVPLKQALEIEQKRLSISGGKLTLMKEEFKLTNLQKKLDFFINEEKQFNNGLHDKTIQKLKAEVDLQKQVVQNAEKLINLEDKKDLELFLKENAKEMRSLEDEDQKNYDDAIKKLDKLKESSNSVTKNLEDQNKLNLIKLSGSEYEIALAEKTLGYDKEKLATFDEEAFKIAYNNKLRIDGLMKQKQITEDIKNIMAQDMGNAIKGLITGTQSLNDSLRNVLNNMANAFLNLGIFGNIAGTFTRGASGGLLGAIFRAEGGPVKGGKSYIVGERGPEMFTPGSSGMITPNNQLGGSTNVVVNVDASGSAVEGDEDKGRELGRLISVAVQSELIQQKRPGGLLA
jgi:hypothetical protein